MTTRSTRNRPPGPSGLPIVGNALEERRRPFAFRTENARRYGDIVYWEFVNKPIYELHHPDDIKYVLVENHQKFIKGEFFQEVIGSFLGNGLLNSEGELWRKQRRLIQPVFHPQQIRKYTGVVAGCTDRTLEAWSDGDRVDIHEEMMELMLEVITRTLLGVEIERDIDRIGHNLDVILHHVDSIQYQLLPSWTPTPGNRRFDRAVGELDDIVYRIIDERDADPDGEDMVSRLLAAENEDGESMDRGQLRDEVMTFLLAGHETTALTLTYTWYLIAMHPEVEGRLLDELSSVLDGTPPSMETVRELTYTDRVLRESLRLYPPVSRFFREPVEDVTIDGYTVPAGSSISLPQWVVHRDPRWYDDPLAFHPERWTEEFKKELPQMAYFPFAAGPRRCIGDRFAHLIATIVLGTVLQEYHLEVCPDTGLELAMTVTSRPANPVWIRVRDRSAIHV